MRALIGIGLVAGTISALLMASAATGSFLSLFLVFFSPLPLFVAGLGFGTAAGLAAAAVGTASALLLGGIGAGLTYLLAVGAAPVWLTRLALLNRPGTVEDARGGDDAPRGAGDGSDDGAVVSGPWGTGRASDAADAATESAPAGAGPDGAEPALAEPAETEADGDWTREMPAGPLEWYPGGHLLTWIAGMGAALVAGAFFATLPLEGGLTGALARELQAYAPLLDELATTLSENGQDITRGELVVLMSTIMPAMAACYWVILMAVNGSVAQWVLGKWGRDLRPGFDIARIELPQGLAMAVAAGALLALLPGEIGFLGATLAAVLGVPFFVTGLVTVHVLTQGWVDRAKEATAGRTPRDANGEELTTGIHPVAIMRIAFLVFFYLFLLGQGIFAIAVAVLGLIDQWAGLRARRLGGTALKESE